jgi:hypothetical protein
MKNLKTTILTTIFAMCCYANVNAQTAPAQQTAKGKSLLIKLPPDIDKEGKSGNVEPNSAKTPPPVQDWKNKRNPVGGHAVTDAKDNTNESDEQQPQQTAKGIKDPAIKSCGSCGVTGKVKAGANPRKTAKDTVGSVEATNKPVGGVGIRAVQHKPGK